MKSKLNMLIGLIILMASCRIDPKKGSENASADSAALADLSKTLEVPWIVELNDSTQMMEIKKNPSANLTNLTELDIIDALNLKYPQIKLEWVKKEGNKAFVKIEDASFLTTQSGTEGARAYLAEVTFSLTEIKGITEVNFSFKEGDHARPGDYERGDFEGFN